MPLVALALCGAAAASEWTTYEQKKGATFEQRDVAGSSYHEFRASIELAVDADAAAAFIWTVATDPASTKTVHKKVVRSAADEVVIYQQMFLPAVSDRDVTLRLWKLPTSADGTREVRWESANDQGPGPEKRFVRMTAVRGTWTVKPTVGGKVQIVFVTFSEPGGSVPAVFVRGPQKDRAAVDFWGVVDKLARP